MLVRPGGTFPNGRSNPITHTQLLEHVKKLLLMCFWCFAGDLEAETVSVEDVL